MDNVVSKLIESIKRAYAKLAENGYDTGKEMICDNCIHTARIFEEYGNADNWEWRGIEHGGKS